MVVRDAKPWSIMTSYNKVNGFHSDMSKELMTNIARREWGFGGIFISDWGGTNSTSESINAGLDLEMPGPPRRRSKQKVDVARKEGKISETEVENSARRILQLLGKAGKFGDSSEQPEECLDSSHTRQLLLEAASSGIVLLKNDRQALPLNLSSGEIKRLAIIGPNAKRIVAGGGGSSYLNAPYWTSIHGSLEARCKEKSVEVTSHVGARVNRYLPTMPLTVARAPDSQHPGAVIEWYGTHDMSRPYLATKHM